MATLIPTECEDEIIYLGRAREVSVRRWIAVVWAVLCAVGLVATWLLSTGADGGKEAAAEAKREAELQQMLAAWDAEHCADMYYGDNFDTQAESSPGVLHIGPGYPSYAPDDRRMLDGLTPQMLAACKKAFPRCDISFNMPCETTLQQGKPGWKWTQRCTAPPAAAEPGYRGLLYRCD